MHMGDIVSVTTSISGHIPNHHSFHLTLRNFHRTLKLVIDRKRKKSERKSQSFCNLDPEMNSFQATKQPSNGHFMGILWVFHSFQSQRRTNRKALERHIYRSRAPKAVQCMLPTTGLWDDFFLPTLPGKL